MSGADVTAIIAHLTSKEVGVTQLRHLKSITEGMLPSSVQLSMVAKDELLRAFHSYSG